MADSADPNRRVTSPRDMRPGQDLPRSVLDHLLEGCQVISPDYRYLYVNEALIRHGRTERAALLGRTMMEAYPGIEHTEMFSILRRCMQTRVHAQMENEFTFPDGSTGWFELRFEPVPDGVAILSIEITDRKRAETALRRTMRALRTLSQCNQTLVRAVNEQQFLEDVCRLVIQVAGYRMAWIGLLDAGDDRRVRPAAHAGIEPEQRELIEGSLSGSAPGDDPLRHALETGASAVTRWGRTGSAADTEAKTEGKHGAAACIALPIRNGDSCLGVLTIYAADPDAFDARERELLDEVALDLGHGVVTLRARVLQERTAAELDQARARTRAIYDRLPHAAFVWRHQTGNFVLTDFNEAASAATDGAANTLLGKSPGEIGSEIPGLEEDLTRCCTSHQSIRREVECQLPGAPQARRLVLTYGFIPPDTVLLHTEDVTEQRRTEAHLAAVHRLEAVGRLAGGVAHDFNNLLSVILTHAEFAATQLQDSDPVRTDITQIHEAGEHAAALTRQLLAFSRKQVLEPQAVNLNDVVGGIEGMLRRLLGEDIDIGIHAAADLGSVMADPSQLDQVILNLTVNARDAMPRGGKLTIETANIELDADYAAHHIAVEPGRYVRLSVTDTGTGMDAQVCSRIFEPFFTTKETGKGTGLGLSTVYGIVKQSGGSIWVYSEPGQGTTFKIYLPRVDTPKIARQEKKPVVAATGSETILIVEDADAVRRAVERILGAAGYRVLSAANGGEALRLCEQHTNHLDLVFTDVVMPEMSGRALADRLQQRNPALKVLFTSGYTDGAIVHHGVLNPGTHFIGKPYSIADLTRKVREVLDAEPGK